MYRYKLNDSEGNNFHKQRSIQGHILKHDTLLESKTPIDFGAFADLVEEITDDNWKPSVQDMDIDIDYSSMKKPELVELIKQTDGLIIDEIELKKMKKDELISALKGE